MQDNFPFETDSRTKTDGLILKKKAQEEFPNRKLLCNGIACLEEQKTSPFWRFLGRSWISTFADVLVSL